MAAWTEHSGQWSAELHANLRDGKLLDRSVIVRRRGERLVIEHWGAKRDLLGRGWVRMAAGRDVEDQPFRELGVWVAGLYRDVLADRKPRLHEIDAVVPQADGSFVRRQYDRLLLPWRDPKGEGYATTVNFVRRTFIIGA